MKNYKTFTNDWHKLKTHSYSDIYKSVTSINSIIYVEKAFCEINQQTLNIRKFGARNHDNADDNDDSV